MKWTARDVINEFETTVDDLNREMQIYTSHRFRQAEWEADLLRLDFPASDTLSLATHAVKSSERAVTNLDDLSPIIKSAAQATTLAADEATKLASEMPAFVALERKEAVDAINEDLRETLTFINRERIVSFEQIGRERIAIL